MSGINATTGRRLTGWDHVKQSITDILTTPIGSRVMRRDYGSRLFELIDRPLNGELMADLSAATIEALARWEPRFVVQKVAFQAPTGSGTAELTLTGIYRSNQVSLEVPL